MTHATSTLRSHREGRVLPTLLGTAGAAALLVGVRLPWLSTFDGLISQNGWGTRNGTVLVVAALAATALATAQMLRPSPSLRWALGGLGLVTAGWSAYLLLQLYALLGSLDGMTLAQKGPGLFLALAGGLVLFSTIFLPLPAAAARSSAGSPTTTLPTFLRPSRSMLRFPVAALALVAALAHVPVTPAHLQEAPYVGVLFVLLTLVLVLGATALLVADAGAVYLGVAAVCVLAVAGYVVSRTVGLPLMADDVGNWTEPLGLVSIAAESTVAVLAAVVLAGRRRAR